MSDVSRARLLRGGFKKPAPPPVRPPWALRDAAAFRNACDGCGDCVPACEPGLIALAEDGLPIVSFAETGCDFCGACAAACAKGALKHDDDAPAWDHVARIGASCLSYQGVECRMCGDHCPTSAIAFQPMGRGRWLPTVIEADCSGCGACVAPCPARAVALAANAPAANALAGAAVKTPSSVERDKACA